jgi:hypothetical protein
VPRAKRSPAEEDGRRDDWLGRRAPARARPWALEEQLFGPHSDPNQQRMIDALEADLANERWELGRLEDELQRRALRIAGLEERLSQLRPTRDEWPGEQRATPAPTSLPSSGGGVERDYLLCRCEGFEVDSPGGRVGIVDGIRYLSRIDQPDVLEVRTGPFGRDLMLIPVGEVDHIQVAEGRLVLRSTPGETTDADSDERHYYLHELFGRLREKKKSRDDALEETLGLGTVEDWPGSSAHET